MSKNPSVLIINKRFKSDFTESQKAIAAKHREAGGNVTVRQNCGDDLPETELVSLSRDSASVAVQSAPAVHVAPARRDFMTDKTLTQPEPLKVRIVRDDGSIYQQV